MFDVGDLVVQAPWDEEVDAVAEVLDEAYCIDQSRCCGNEIKTRNASGNQVCLLTCVNTESLESVFG